MAALPALTGVCVGGLALAHSAGRIRTGPGRRGAMTALAAGLTGMALGGAGGGHRLRWPRHRLTA
ncbi:DUF6223 family protein [Streptomyces sparsogenes]|uniref:DUF6223 family protein n=1 Tax=Streptomyces sparsogenes TaxID=67365 RepID=UPI0033E5920D